MNAANLVACVQAMDADAKRALLVALGGDATVPNSANLMTVIGGAAAPERGGQAPARLQVEEVGSGSDGGEQERRTMAVAGGMLTVGAPGSEASSPSNEKAAGVTPVSAPRTAAELSAAMKVIAANDRALEAAKQDGELRYSQTRGTRKVTKVTASWPAEVQAKYKGIAVWERIDLLCQARAYQEPCPAKRVVDRRCDTHEIIHIDDSKAEHVTHTYKKRARLDEDVAARARELAVQRVPPALAEELLAQEARREAEGSVPKRNRTCTKRQYERIAYYEQNCGFQLPKGDVIEEAGRRFGPCLLSTETWNFNWVYMSPWQVAYAKREKVNVLLLDSTFKRVVGGLLLTTLLARVEHSPRVYIPLAFCIHMHESAEELTHFLSCVVKKTGVAPKAVLRDFGKGVKKAIEDVFGKDIGHGDLFHFIDANQNWLRKHGYADERIKEIITDLRGVATYVDCFETFGRLFAKFKTKYRSEPYMSEYFTPTWEGTYKVPEWAIIYRRMSHTAIDVPTGDQPLEGQHLRYDRFVFNGLCEQGLVSVLVRLDREAKHWETVISNPRLLEGRMEEAERRAGMRGVAVLPTVDTRPSGSLAALVALRPGPRVTTTAAQDQVVEFYEKLGSADPPGTEPPLPPLGPPSVALSAVARLRDPCPVCHKNAPAKQCTKQRCLRCCAAEYGECHISEHNTRRLDGLLRPIFEDMDAYILACMNREIDSDERVWIRYKTPDEEQPSVKEIYNVRWADTIEPSYKEKRKDYFTADHVKVHEPERGSVTHLIFKFGRLYAFSRTPLE